jgi:porin
MDCMMREQIRVVVGVLFVLISAISANGQNCACCCDSAAATPAMVTPNYSGCWQCREYLLGDMCGARTHFAKQGVTLEGDITQYYQGVTSGGLDENFEYGLHSDRVFTFDMDKLAGMQGMFLKVRHETQLGDFINEDTGALLAANTSGLLPTVEGDVTAITNFTLIQMLSPTFGFYAGKLDTMDGDENAYAHGRGKKQFMNIGLVATPIAFRTTPYSTWGAGMMVLGEEGTPIFNLAVLDPRDFATTINLDDIFEEGVTISAELRLPTNFLNKPGHQLFGGVWSSRDVALLSTAPRLLLPNVPTPTSSDSWALYWNFDQQLVPNCCDPTKGWGVFGRAAIADEDTNPLEWFLSFGIGGNSPIRCRQNDTFGVGWFYGATSDQLPGLLLGDAGQGVELFYNYEVTPWLHITPDLQFIDPARRNVDDATVFGIRVNMTL